MDRDVRMWVSQCAHCILANNTTHERERMIRSYPCANPFDAVFMDVWTPGELDPGLKQTKNLTVMDSTSSFVVSITLESVDSFQISRKAFLHVFTVFGLPFNVFIDDGSEFKLVLKATCQILGITWEAVSR